MKVTIKDKSTKERSFVGEMSVGFGHIAEMVTDATRLDQWIPGASLKGAALATAAGDEHPEFPIVRVEEGWSGSKRLWTADELVSIAEQTNRLEPVGHLGHIPDADAATAFPEPQTTWIGAITRSEPSKLKERLGEMVTVAYFAGYNLPGAKIRTYIKTKAVRGVSWWGTGEQVVVPGKGVQVKNFRLKSLDWARKLAEGMPSSSIVGIASEMEAKGMDKELAQVTPDEFKKENPNGYQLLVTEVTAVKDEQIAEMEEKVKTGEEAQSLLSKVCEAVGLDPTKVDDIVTKIEELKNRVGEKASATVKTALDKLLAEKIPGDTDEAKRKRALVARCLPVGEMENKVADAKPDDADNLIGEMVDEAFNTDEDIKELVSEMTPPVITGRRESGNSASDTDKALTGYGMTRERVSMGS